MISVALRRLVGALCILVSTDVDYKGRRPASVYNWPLGSEGVEIEDVATENARFLSGVSGADSFLGSHVVKHCMGSMGSERGC